jgi:WD40 repeat protein
VRFSADGKLAATSSDDGTVRLWDPETGKPFWHSAGMLRDPPRIYSHRGWLALEQGVAGEPPKGRWRAAAEGARKLAVDRGSRHLCLVDHQGSIELWDLAADRRRFQDRRQKITAILAVESGCVVLAGGQALLYARSGAFKELGAGVSTLAPDGEGILVASGRKVIAFDATGAQRAVWDGEVGVTAITRVDGRLVLGFPNGSIEPALATGTDTGPLSFEGVPSSPVVQLMAGPPGTLVAGFADGTLGIWSLEHGTRLDHVTLYGPVVHLQMGGEKLYAATELGDYRVIDLSAFHVEHCVLLRRAWQAIPVVWEGGRPVLRAPPKKHRCVAP